MADGALLIFDPAPDVRLPRALAPERVIVLLSRSPDAGAVRAVAHVRQWAAATGADVEVSAVGRRGYVVRLKAGTGEAPDRRPLFVYAGATRPCYATVAAAEGAAVMIHDASYDETDTRAAGIAGYSTAGQAAVVARAAGVGRLVLVPLRGVTAEARAVLEREATRLFG